MLATILDILIRATLRGAVEVLSVRRSGAIETGYKDARELVTAADSRSDAAIRAVLTSELAALDPAIAIRLEESGGATGHRWVGADPLDGTNHFASGGTSYCVQAHYIADGVPEVGVVLQPEVFLPLAESDTPLGRLAYAIRGQGAHYERTEFRDGAFLRAPARPLRKQPLPPTKTYVACVPFSTKMTPDEWQRARRVLESGLVSVTTGIGCSGGNTLLALFGGHHVYANFGAGDDLDLVPPQVIAQEAGLSVWAADRRPPVWRTRKQPVIFAPNPEIAERFLRAAGI